MKAKLRKLDILLAIAVSAACSIDDHASNATMGGNAGKADTPESSETFCLARECATLVRTAIDSGGLLARDFVRWPAGDRDAVTGPRIELDADGRPFVAGEFDHRGQEYNEYFAILDLDQFGPEPTGEPKPLVLGRTMNDEELPAERYWFDPAQDLTEAQRSWLDDGEHDEHIVGSCIYTGWHWDRFEPPRNPDVDAIHGVEVNYDNFRMFGPFNVNGAANALVMDGLEGIADRAIELREAADRHLAASGESGPLATQHTAYNTCIASEDFAVAWRFSDGHAVTVPTVIMRECGCYAQVGDTVIDHPRGIADVVIPETGELAYESPILRGGFLRGFPIGSWGDPLRLPRGCSYVGVDDPDPEFDSRILVRCDIPAGELAGGGRGGLTPAQLDLKEHCRTREQLGQMIVVHVPLPGDLLHCEPASDAPAHCFEADGVTPRVTPWDGAGLLPTVSVTDMDLELVDAPDVCF